MNKPILVPQGEVTSLGSAIFAFLAAGAFQTIEEAQAALCPGYTVVHPDAKAVAIYEDLFPIYRELYFSFGIGTSPAVELGHVLPALRRIAARARGEKSASIVAG
jgi:L-ribulokinase